MKSKTKYIFLILIGFLVSHGLTGQTQYTIDSLLHLLKISHDTNKIQIYKELAWKLRNNNPPIAYNYAFEALQIAVNKNDKAQQATIYNYMGVIRRNQNEYSTALGFFFKALSIAEEIENKKEIAYAFNNIGDIYSRQRNDSMALIHFNKALELFDQIDDKRGKAYASNQMGLVYTNTRDFEKALYFINQTISLRREIKDYVGIAVCYRNMGDVYALQDDFEKALQYYNQSLKLDKKVNAQLGIAYTYNHIGILFNKEGLFENAVPYLDSAYEVGEKIKSLYVKNVSTEELSYAYAALKDYENAYYYMYEHKVINDSLVNLEASSRITQLIMQHDFDKQQEETSRINQLELRKQRTIRNSFIIGFVIAIIIIFLVYRSYSISKKSRKELEFKNKQIEDQKEELIQKNEQLIESENVIRQANATKDKFFSIIAHDLKSPFSAIFGFSNLLYTEFESFDEKSKKEYIKNISGVSENAYKLLQNLLEWARSQTGQIDYQPEEINIGLIASDNVTLLKSVASKKNITLENQIDFQTYAFGDKNMVNTVLRNLISNAIKFSYIGGIIKIDSKEKEKFLQVMVSDTGVGLSKEDKSKLFQIDEKFKKEGTEKEKGTGLGLILSREFIERNGGEIWVESELGKGSKFFFTLPLHGPSLKRKN